MIVVVCGVQGNLDTMSQEGQVAAIRAAVETGGEFAGYHYEHALLAATLAVADGLVAPDQVKLLVEGKRIELDRDGSFLDPWPTEGGLGALRRALLRGSWAVTA